MNDRNIFMTLCLSEAKEMVKTMKTKLNNRIKMYGIRTLEIAIIIIFLVLAIFRIYRAIDFTDESWYFAEPYAVAEMGSIPFVDNVSQSPGYTMPLFLAFKLFIMINGGTDGIVLFSRYLFIVVSFLSAILFVGICNRYTTWKVPYVTVASIFWAAEVGSRFDINYRTVGTMYLPVILAIIFAEYEDNSKKSYLWGGIAGVLATRTVMGTLQVLVALCFLFLFLCIQKKWKRITGILIGCIVACLLIFIPPMFVRGFGFLVKWIQMYLNQGYFLIGNLGNFQASVGVLKKLVIYAFSLLFFLGIAKIIIKNILIYDFIIKLIIAALTIIGVCLSIIRGEYYGISLSYLLWSAPFVYGLYSVKRSRNNKYAMISCMAYTLVYLFVSYTTVVGFGDGKAYWLSFSYILMLLMIYNDVLKTKENDDSKWNTYRELCINCLITLAIISIGIFKVWSGYAYVYRDDKIVNLQSKIERGIWKGIYTTELRARNVVGIEQFLRSVTNNGDEILCLDWASFAYVMVNGNICSPTTLDANYNTYEINSPNPYYMYFAVVNKVPNKIIYIDYGRDEVVSIDKEDWKFNDFVDSFYDETHHYSNDIFNVRLFEIQDRSGALEMAKENAVFK